MPDAGDTGIWCYFDVGVKCSMCGRRGYCQIDTQTSCGSPNPDCDGPVTCACILAQDPCRILKFDTVKCEEVSPACALLICDAGASG